jgi:hypothetical protein
MGQPVTQWQIISKDPQRAGEFYQRVFGWSVRTDNPLGYRQVDTGSTLGAAGGMDRALRRMPAAALSETGRYSSRQGKWLVILRHETWTGGLTESPRLKRQGRVLTRGSSSAGTRLAKHSQRSKALALDVPIGGTDNAAELALGHRLSGTHGLRGNDQLLEVRGEMEEIEDLGDARSLQTQRAGDLCSVFDGAVVECPP